MDKQCTHLWGVREQPDSYYGIIFLEKEPEETYAIYANRPDKKTSLFTYCPTCGKRLEHDG